MAQLEQRLVEIDGATLEVFIGGAGPVVCNAHGLGVQSAAGNTVSRALAGMCRIVLANARGMGNSSPAPAPATRPYSQLADDMEALRRRLGVDRWVYAGDAGGSGSALLYALRYPRALAGLILGFSTPSVPRVLADARSGLSPRHPRNRRVDLGALPAPPAAERASSWTPLPDGRWLWRRAGRPTLFWPYGLSDQVRAAWEEIVAFDVLDRLAEIRVPTLVLAGGRDELIPVDCTALLTGIPGAEFVVLE
jgi:pimeloyl-ACP methyl ester carboxylesterase